eukprot:13712066-Alexandrium_andersonii.AAC.1
MGRGLVASWPKATVRMASTTTTVLAAARVAPLGLARLPGARRGPSAGCRGLLGSPAWVGSGACPRRPGRDGRRAWAAAVVATRRTL